MSKELSPVEAVGLTMLALLVMFVLRRLGGAGRSVKRSVHHVKGPAVKMLSDILDGPGARPS
jgi:hypothetical protein